MLTSVTYLWSPSIDHILYLVCGRRYPVFVWKFPRGFWRSGNACWQVWIRFLCNINGWKYPRYPTCHVHRRSLGNRKKNWTWNNKGLACRTVFASTNKFPKINWNWLDDIMEEEILPNSELVEKFYVFTVCKYEANNYVHKYLCHCSIAQPSAHCFDQ